MDAHDPPPPSQPVARNFSSAKYTASDYTFQFVTVTAGVLIALLVNGLVEARNNRNLVRDARATIAREIADNRSDLDKTLAGYGGDDKALEQAIKFATEMNLFVEQQRSMVSRLAAASAILSSEFNPDDPNPKDLEGFRVLKP